jgi:disulfide bond formation protein DsbB
MLNRISLRIWYLLLALACAGLLGAALYFEHQMFLDPCPLCILQRIAFLWMGVFGLLGALVGPRGGLRWLFSGLIALGGVVGAWLAARHVWIQGLPEDQLPACGPNLEYMLDTLPLAEVLNKVLAGDGSCADVQWSFLGLSMPAWTLVWYIGLTVLTLVFTVRKTHEP